MPRGDLGRGEERSLGALRVHRWPGPNEVGLMSFEEIIPEVTITIDRGRHCWCFKLGSHLIPIRKGLYTEAVAASIVASEVRTLTQGPVRVRTEL